MKTWSSWIVVLWTVLQTAFAQTSPDKGLVVDEGGSAYLVDFAQGSVQALPIKAASQPSLSPYYQYAVLNSSNEVTLVQLSDGATQILMPGSFQTALWSKDGSKLLLLQYLQRKDQSFETHIYLWDANTKKVLSLE